MVGRFAVGILKPALSSSRDLRRISCRISHMRPNTKPTASSASIAVSSNTSGSIEVVLGPDGLWSSSHAKVSKSLSQPPALGIRHSLAAHTTVVWQERRRRVSLSESPASFITALLPVIERGSRDVLVRLGQHD